MCTCTWVGIVHVYIQFHSTLVLWNWRQTCRSPSPVCWCLYVGLWRSWLVRLYMGCNLSKPEWENNRQGLLCGTTVSYIPPLIKHHVVQTIVSQRIIKNPLCSAIVHSLNENLVTNSLSVIHWGAGIISFCEQTILWQAELWCRQWRKCYIIICPKAEIETWCWALTLWNSCNIEQQCVRFSSSERTVSQYFLLPKFITFCIIIDFMKNEYCQTCVTALRQSHKECTDLAIFSLFVNHSWKYPSIYSHFTCSVCFKMGTLLSREGMRSSWLAAGGRSGWAGCYLVSQHGRTGRYRGGGGREWGKISGEIEEKLK